MTSTGRGPRVHLIEVAGGHPQGIALEAVAALKSAEVILYDRLARPAVLNLGNPDAEWTEVPHAADEEEEVLAALEPAVREWLRQGAQVARLKGCQQGNVPGVARPGEVARVAEVQWEQTARAWRAAGFPCRWVPAPLGTASWDDPHPPLLGCRVLVTRPRHQAAALTGALEQLGAQPVEFGAVRMVPPPDWQPFDAALDRIATYDWLVFTSANGVRFALARLRQRGLDVRDWKGLRLAAIGPATAEALREANLNVELVPEEYRAEGLAAAMEAHGLRPGSRVLLARALEARDVLPCTLREAGVHVDEVPVYKTVEDGRGAAIVKGLLDDGQLDVLTFTSPSTVRAFIRAVGVDGRSVEGKGVGVVCIGPITAAAAEEAGLPVHGTAEVYTVPGLVQAVVDFWQKRRKGRMN